MSRKDMKRTVDEDGIVRYDGFVAIQESISNKLAIDAEKSVRAFEHRLMMESD
jgi:hypothetical protein